MELNDSAVVRRPTSEMTHVAALGGVATCTFIRPYWGTQAVTAACGVRIQAGSVIMATGTKTRCRACIHATGITEQPPSVREKLGDPIA
jgi:hypothetical protein